MPMPMPMAEGVLGIPDARAGSGTAWLPDSSPMHAAHFRAGKRTLATQPRSSHIAGKQYRPFNPSASSSHETCPQVRVYRY